MSLPTLCIGLGALLSLVPPISGLAQHFERNIVLAEHATEAVVVLSLIGAERKIDRPIGLRRWAVTWRMLGIAMP